MKPRSLLYRIAVMVLLFITVVPPLSAQTSLPDPVLELMAQMSPEVKVGQLALVSFPGDSLPEESDISSLIRDYHIGGVYLRPENGNFGSPTISSTQLISLTNRLQTDAWDASQSISLPVGGEAGMPYRPPFIPLFVSVEPGAAGVAVTKYIDDMAQMPTPLAIGATWDPAMAQASGALLGKQLSAMGINLYLGPDLDVLYSPRPGYISDLGTSVFGGDPFWVGRMGTAFISGLHTGSDNTLMVIPRHLPGLGSADRAPVDEVPTVQKPLEQLKQIELAPFFAAAAGSPGDAGIADGFLVTHIRYRGFQGNIRQTTRPISLDAQALQLLTSLVDLSGWRQEGGVLVSDNLGVPAVHSFYDPTGVTFNARRVTQDALVAGNDLLIFDHFAADDDWTMHFTNVRDTLKFLAALYKDDAAFSAMIDAALYRVLSMKFRMYNPEPADPSVGFALEEVVVQHSEAAAILDEANQNEAVGSPVASKSLTLLFPLAGDIRPSPPQEGDEIVIFTQEWELRRTPDGSIQMLSADQLERALMRFYGQDGTGTLRVNAVRSFTYPALNNALELPPATLTEEMLTTEDGQRSAQIWNALATARWIVFVTSDLLDAPDIEVLSTFLAQEANVLDAHIAVIAMGAPYALDSTEVTKLDLFYASFSTEGHFVDTVARALFDDAVPLGASPVDISALDYSLQVQTMPEPAQFISFSVVTEAGEPLTDTAQVNIHVGDMVNLRTAAILDRNGHIVPDGTPVQFLLAYPQESTQRTVWAVTKSGMAQASFTLDRVGRLDITALSEPALSSTRLELTIRDDGVTIEEFEPTPTPSPTPTQQPLPTATLIPTATPVPEKTFQMPDRFVIPTPDRTALMGWGAVAVSALMVLGFIFAREQSIDEVKSLRIALLGVSVGLSAYVVVMLFARLWVPVIMTYLINREYLSGTLVLILGGATIATAIGLQSIHRRQAPGNERH